MVIHMKTTLNIDDTVMAQLKREARQGRTMSDLVETALRNLFQSSRKKPGDLPPLPVFHSGGARVDISDRDALYQAMEETRGASGRPGRFSPRSSGRQLSGRLSRQSTTPTSLSK
jgi:hypothetical protein